MTTNTQVAGQNHAHFISLRFVLRSVHFEITILASKSKEKDRQRDTAILIRVKRSISLLFFIKKICPYSIINAREHYGTSRV